MLYFTYRSDLRIKRADRQLEQSSYLISRRGLVAIYRYLLFHPGLVGRCDETFEIPVAIAR